MGNGHGIMEFPLLDLLKYCVHGLLAVPLLGRGSGVMERAWDRRERERKRQREGEGEIH